MEADSPRAPLTFSLRVSKCIYTRKSGGWANFRYLKTFFSCFFSLKASFAGHTRDANQSMHSVRGFAYLETAEG